MSLVDFKSKKDHVYGLNSNLKKGEKIAKMHYIAIHGFAIFYVAKSRDIRTRKHTTSFIKIG